MWGQRTVAVAPVGTTANSQQIQTLIGKFDVAF
jgi:hypothetical protein